MDSPAPTNPSRSNPRIRLHLAFDVFHLVLVRLRDTGDWLEWSQVVLSQIDIYLLMGYFRLIENENMIS